MNRTVVGLFDERGLADKAVDDLLDQGIGRDRISVLSTSTSGTVSKEDTNLAAEGAATGLATGAIVGGILGLLAGAGAVMIPIGLAVAGPLAGLLAGSAAGAATGGILGGLIGLGIPEDHAHAYLESVRHGSVLVSVQCRQEEIEEVERLLDRDGAVNVHQRAAALRELGRTDVNRDPELSPEDWSKVRDRWTPGEGVLEHEQHVMERERSRVASYVRPDPPSVDKNLPTGRREVNAEEDLGAYQEIFQPESDEHIDTESAAYRFGYDAARGEQFGGRDWSAAEAELQQEWSDLQGGTWDQNRLTILAGWNRSHAIRTEGGAELL